MQKKKLVSNLAGLAALMSLISLTGCSGSGTSHTESTGANQSDNKESTTSSTAGDGANARDIFYHSLSHSGGTSSASGGSSGSASGGSAGAGGGSSGGSASAPGNGGANDPMENNGNLATAFCWEIRSAEMGPMAIMCHTFPKSGFKNGDGLRFHFRPSQPCYAYILMFKGSSGKKYVPLYPPDGHDEKLEPGKEYTVPPDGMLTFDDKPGEEDMGFIMTANPINGQKAIDLTSQTKPFDPNQLSAGRSLESNALSLFSASDAKVPASEYKEMTRDDAANDPFVYADNSKTPGKPLAAIIPFPHN
jgi:hypothetical protein